MRKFPVSLEKRDEQECEDDCESIQLQRDRHTVQNCSELQKKRDTNKYSAKH